MKIVNKYGHMIEQVKRESQVTMSSKSYIELLDAVTSYDELLRDLRDRLQVEMLSEDEAEAKDRYVRIVQVKVTPLDRAMADGLVQRMLENLSLIETLAARGDHYYQPHESYFSSYSWNEEAHIDFLDYPEFKHHYVAFRKELGLESEEE